MTGYAAKGILCPKGCGELIAVDPLDTMDVRVGDHWTKDHQTVPQGTLDYGKGYSDGFAAALAQTLAAIHDMDSVQLAFRGDPTKATAPAVYVALDAIVEILRSGPPQQSG